MDQQEIVKQNYFKIQRIRLTGNNYIKIYGM